MGAISWKRLNEHGGRTKIEEVVAVGHSGTPKPKDSGRTSSYGVYQSRVSFIPPKKFASQVQEHEYNWHLEHVTMIEDKRKASAPIPRNRVTC